MITNQLCCHTHLCHYTFRIIMLQSVTLVSIHAKTYFHEYAFSLHTLIPFLQ